MLPTRSAYCTSQTLGGTYAYGNGNAEGSLFPAGARRAFLVGCPAYREGCSRVPPQQLEREGEGLAFIMGGGAKVDLPQALCELFNEEFLPGTASPSFDVDRMLDSCFEVPELEVAGASAADATVPTTPPPVETVVSTTPALAVRNSTTIRTPTKEEILAAAQSNEVLLAGRQQWANLLSQAERVLTAQEIATLKKNRRRAKGAVDARNSRNKRKKGAEKNGEQFDAVMRQNKQLQNTVAQMGADNAALQKELAALRNQLAVNNNAP